LFLIYVIYVTYSGKYVSSPFLFGVLGGVRPALDFVADGPGFATNNFENGDTICFDVGLILFGVFRYVFFGVPLLDASPWAPLQNIKLSLQNIKLS